MNALRVDLKHKILAQFFIDKCKIQESFPFNMKLSEVPGQNELNVVFTFEIGRKLISSIRSAVGWKNCRPEKQKRRIMIGSHPESADEADSAPRIRRRLMTNEYLMSLFQRSTIIMIFPMPGKCKAAVPEIKRRVNEPHPVSGCFRRRISSIRDPFRRMPILRPASHCWFQASKAIKIRANYASARQT